MLHDLLQLSPNPIISVEYERKRYVVKMEEDALDRNFVPDGWLSDDDPSLPPPAKKKRLLLSLTKKARASHSTAVSTSRFAPPITEVQFTEAAKGIVPINT